jgi:hypothetical protein
MFIIQPHKSMLPPKLRGAIVHMHIAHAYAYATMVQIKTGLPFHGSPLRRRNVATPDPRVLIEWIVQLHARTRPPSFPIFVVRRVWVSRPRYDHFHIAYVVVDLAVLLGFLGVALPALAADDEEEDDGEDDEEARISSQSESVAV